MTEIQGILLELVDEIHTICVENNLKYFLATEAALSAYRSSSFESEPNYLTVYMTLKDAVKLNEIVLSKNLKDRVIDSLFVNDYYPNLTFNYCNKNTLFFNLRSNSGLNAFGIGIKIVVLKKEYKGVLGKLASVLENGWIYNYKDYHMNSKSRKRILLKNITSLLLKLSRKGYKKLMLTLIANTQNKVTYNDSFIVKTIKNKKVVFPKKIFGNIQNVQLHDHTYWIPLNADAYFKSIYNLRWKNTVFNKKEINEMVIVDSRLPYEYYFEYLRKNNITINYQSFKQDDKKLKAEIKQLDKPIETAWNIVLRTGARIKLWQKYMPIKEKIISMYENNDWEGLNSIFKEYDEIAQVNYKRKLGVCFDKDLFYVYKALLEHNGENQFAEELETLIPETHWRPIEIKDN